METQVIGIAGSGVMGGGIAQMFAENGFQVLVWDVKPELAVKGVEKIRQRLDGSVAKGKLAAADAAAAINRIKAVGELGELAGADLVIEAVIEDFAVKKQLYQRLEKSLRPDTVIGTNTSSLSVAELAKSLTARPERFFGVHFFNPPTKLELVELIVLPDGCPEALGKVKNILAACGKTAVEVRDSPGFIVNRLLLPFINSAARLIDEQVASAENIDAAMTLGALHPAGPLKVADLIGLDVCKHILESLAEATNDPDMRPAKSLVELVAAGKLGRKTKQGFHTY